MRPDSTFMDRQFIREKKIWERELSSLSLSWIWPPTVPSTMLLRVNLVHSFYIVDFHASVKLGVSAVIHVATVTNMSPLPHDVIPSTISGALGALKAAANEPSVAKFVLTTSSAALIIASPNTEVTVDENTWNTLAVEEAWKGPPYEPSRALSTYAASKTQSEEEVWKWYKENNPRLVVNTGTTTGIARC